MLSPRFWGESLGTRLDDVPWVFLHSKSPEDRYSTFVPLLFPPGLLYNVHNKRWPAEAWNIAYLVPFIVSGNKGKCTIRHAGILVFHKSFHQQSFQPYKIFMRVTSARILKLWAIKASRWPLKSKDQECTATIWPLTPENQVIRSLRKERSGDQAHFLPVANASTGDWISGNDWHLAKHSQMQVTDYSTQVSRWTLQNPGCHPRMFGRSHAVHAIPPAQGVYVACWSVCNQNQDIWSASIWFHGLHDSSKDKMVGTPP